MHFNKKWGRIGLAVTLLAGILILSGCKATAKVQPANVAKDGDTVKVDYTLTLDDGSQVDSSVGGEPFQFTLGAGDVIPGFNDAVLGMKVGETVTVKLTPKEGYGDRQESLVSVYDRAQMPAGLTPSIGLQLQAQKTDGTLVVVTITAFDDSTVTVDANPPLAGKNLNFTIKLLEILSPDTGATATDTEN